MLLSPLAALGSKALPPKGAHRSKADWLSEHAVTCWLADYRASPVSARECAPYHRLLDEAGHELAWAFDELIGDRTAEEQERLLFFVGTLCVARGHAALWSTIYRKATYDPTPDAEWRFLEQMTMAARRELPATRS